MNGYGALTGRQQHGLINALIDAFVTRAEFEMLLALQLDRSFEDIVGEGRLRLCVFRLVRTAMGEGWLPDLIDAAVSAAPRNAELKVWIESVGHVASVPRAPVGQAPPRPHQLLQTMYFDLEELRNVVARAEAEAVDQILAFGITYPDSVYIRKLCDWLESYLGDTQQKESLALAPELTFASTQLRALARYKRDLESSNVLCTVHCLSAPAEIVAEFWHGVRHIFAEVGRYLVLVFASHGDAVFPPGVIVLPPPRFEVSHISVWTHDMVRLLGWPTGLASAWTEMLRDEAAEDDLLDVRGLYEAMDRSLQEVQFMPTEFRQRLEGIIGRGHATQT